MEIFGDLRIKRHQGVQYKQIRTYTVIRYASSPYDSHCVRYCQETVYRYHRIHCIHSVRNARAPATDTPYSVSVRSNYLYYVYFFASYSMYVHDARDPYPRFIQLYLWMIQLIQRPYHSSFHTCTTTYLSVDGAQSEID
jgi:hypothetical protein